MTFFSHVTLIFDKWPSKTIRHLFQLTSSIVHHLVAIGKFKLELQSGNAQFGSKFALFVTCDLEIWQMTFKNNRAPPQCYFKLCASFHSHLWIQSGVTVQKRPIHYCDVIMGRIASQITSLTIVCSTVYSGADQRKYQSSASLAFVRGIHQWPVNSPHKWPVTRKMFPFDDVIMLGQNRRFFIYPCDLEIWWMILKNNRALLLCYFKLCASFHSQLWIQTGFTVRKRPIWVKIDDWNRPWNLTDDLEKQ